MRLRHARPEVLSQSGTLLSLLVTQGRGGTFPDTTLGRRVKALVAGKAFDPAAGKTLVLHAEEKGGPKAALLVGLGKPREVTGEALRRAGYRIGIAAASQGVKAVAVAAADGVLAGDDALAALGEGLVLSAYRYPLKKAEDKPPAEALLVGGGKGAAAALKRAQAVAEGVNLARELGDLPGNVATPAHLKKAAAEVCRKGGLRFKAHDKAALKRLKMGGILAVNQGSAEPPFLLEMDYAPSGAKRTVCVVGKGLTFDSGGISLKPAANMEEMKYDMCGAAATIGLMAAVAATRPRGVRVVGLVGTTENMGGSAAYKPGDVITTASGSTIEVINTDAEGRVVLADCLHHARRFEPDAVVDMATLTGAIVVSLGHEAAGLFCKDDALARRLLEAAERTGERLWRMPTYDEYAEAVKGRWGDVKNSAGRDAGACTAAAFLFHFSEGLAHAHIDIAGTAWGGKSKGDRPDGASGYGVRLLHDALTRW